MGRFKQAAMALAAALAVVAFRPQLRLATALADTGSAALAITASVVILPAAALVAIGGMEAITGSDGGGAAYPAVGLYADPYYDDYVYYDDYPYDDDDDYYDYRRYY